MSIVKRAVLNFKGLAKSARPRTAKVDSEVEER